MVKTFAKQSRTITWSCLLLGTLICLRAVNDVFLYPAALCGIVLFLFCRIETCYVLIFFLLPFANIFKINTDAISIETLLFAILVVRMFLNGKDKKTSFIVLLILTVCYSIIISSMGKLIAIVSLAFGFIFVYESKRIDVVCFRWALLAFTAGICMSSTLALFRGSLPLLNNYVKDIMQKLGEGYYVDRFAGLQGNPNYYTMDISIAISCIVALFCIRRAGFIHVIGLALLTVFGFLSLSKSFLVIWVVLLAALVIFSFTSGAKSFIKTLLLVLVLMGAVYYFAFDTVNIYVQRFFGSSITTLSDFTTSRTSIWSMYFEAMRDNLGILFFGNGIHGTLVNATGSHNTYIELVYSVGIIGTFLYMATMRAAIVLPCRRRRRVWLYIPVFVLLIRLIAIGALTFDNLWYYLSLIYVLFLNYGGEAIDVENH